MALRTLYLQRYLSLNGRNALAGRHLFDELRAVSDDSLLGHMVVLTEDAPKFSDPRFGSDVIPVDLVRQLDPNVVYLENGLLIDESRWRLPRPVADDLLSRGCVIIVADVDANEAADHPEAYEQAHDFFRAGIRYEGKRSPVYGADLSSFWHGHRQVVCHPGDMVISEWLRPIYDGVGEIMVGLPVRLNGWQHLVASGNQHTTGTMHDDLWIDRIDGCPFASVAKISAGYVVLIAGSVSPDGWLKRCPGNTIWLTNLARFLADDAARDAERSASHLRSPHLLFLSHRSSDKAGVSEVAKQIQQRGVGVWLDGDRLVPSDSLSARIGDALGKMTHYVLFWSKSASDSPWVSQELNIALAQRMERQSPILLVRLDDTPVPPMMSDLFRIEAKDMEPSAIGDAIVDAVERLAKRTKGLGASGQP